MGAYLEHLIHAYGYAGIFAVVALENIGLLVPGETILITSAIFAAETHELGIVGIVVTAAAAAFAGSVIGFTIGRYGERHLVRRFGRYLHVGEPDLRLGRYLFGCYGGRVVFAARFIAFLRALVGLLAGLNRMDWRSFLVFSALGAAAWAAAFGFGAYALGKRIQTLSSGATLLIAVAVALAAIWGFRFLRHNRTRLQREADRMTPR